MRFSLFLLFTKVNLAHSHADTSRECPISMRSKCVNGGKCQVYREGDRDVYRCVLNEDDLLK